MAKWIARHSRETGTYRAQEMMQVFSRRSVAQGKRAQPLLNRKRAGSPRHPPMSAPASVLTGRKMKPSGLRLVAIVKPMRAIKAMGP